MAKKLWKYQEYEQLIDVLEAENAILGKNVLVGNRSVVVEEIGNPLVPQTK